MKQIISLFLALIMTISVMAVASGCSGKENANSDLLKGKTIRIASWGTAKPSEGTEDGDLKLAAIAEAEEKYGCKVEWVTITDLTQQLLTAATTGQVVADVIMQRSHRVVELLMKGDYFWSVEDLGGNPKDEIYNQDTTKFTSYNGKTYGWWYDPTNVNSMIAINKEIINRVDKSLLPYNLVEDKKWTFEAYKDLMIKTTNPEQGILGGSHFGSVVQYMMHCNNTGIYTEKDGIHIANTDDPRLNEVFEFLSNAVVTEKIMDTRMGAATNVVTQDFISGKYTTLEVGRATMRDTFSKKLKPENWGIMPLPIGPSADDYVKLDNECKTFCIQKAIDQDLAKALFQFMNETMVAPLDEEDLATSMYRAFAPDEESFKNLMLVQSKPLTMVTEYTTPDLRNYTGNTVTASLNGMANGTKPIKSTLDALKNEIQGILDEYYNQESKS